jgi:DNA-binding response OmpR family regulator
LSVHGRGAGERGAVRGGESARQPKRRAAAILVVSSAEPLRKLIANVLTDEGFEVVTAASSVEALDLLADGFSLVLVDLDTPRAAGVDRVRLLREAWPGLRILCTSADADLLQEASRAGADALMIKPLSPDDLRIVVRLVLG